MDAKKIIAGAAAGAVAAIVVDIDAWIACEGEKYDYRIALARCLKGIVTGAAVAAGINQV